MSVRIRLRRMGRKKQPHYRVVVADGAAPRDGRVVENLGYYKPRSNPARLVLDLERFDYWVTKGAEPSETVRSLAGKARRGGDATVALGELDVQTQKKAHTDALAARRTVERKDRESSSDAKVRVEPQDTGHGEPAASSTTDATAAEVMADGAERAIEDAEDDAPENAPDGSMAKQAAAKSRRGGKTKPSGTEGASGNE
jgi:small subunit ribosomal protein S16